MNATLKKVCVKFLKHLILRVSAERNPPHKHSCSDWVKSCRSSQNQNAVKTQHTAEKPQRYLAFRGLWLVSVAVAPPPNRPAPHVIGRPSTHSSYKSPLSSSGGLIHF